MRVLYLSYDGALDPLGASQVVPYVEGLAARGHRFDLITYEKPERWRAEERSRVRLLERLREDGIEWHPLPYHRRPSVAATAYDLHVGLRKARALHAIEPFDLVHVRSYPCATIALSLSRSFGVPYLFDMRGLYPEERVDGRIWSAGGPLYFLAKRLERDFLRGAHAVVTLTRASTDHVQSLMDAAGSAATLDVIPTAVNLDRFVPARRSEPARILYLGSVGTWYRVDAMLELAKVWLHCDDTVIVEFLVNGDTSRLAEQVRAIGSSRLHVRSIPHEAVPGALSGALATFAVIDPAPSKIASAPTKIGESLAAGLPVLVNRGVGDVADWIEEAGVGVVLEGLNAAAYRQAATALLQKAVEPGIKHVCRDFAERVLSLQRAVDRYDAIYSSVGGAARRPVTL